jgi:hypothetical protein
MIMSSFMTGKAHERGVIPKMPGQTVQLGEVLILGPIVWDSSQCRPLSYTWATDTVNISQMDYNLPLVLGDMDELIRCDGGHGSPVGICFDKSVRKVHDPPKFVHDFVRASGKFGLLTSIEQVPNVN